VKKKTEGEGANKREVEYTEYYAQGVGNVKMGIRSYHNKSKSIVDQQLFTETKTWEAVGKNAIDAAALLISKSEANRYLATAVGSDYAYKISPMPVTISRDFYGKSKHTPAMARGTRFADVNDWSKAIDHWKSALSTPNEKDAGKLAYNIAVGYEVLGEYGTALTWARDAYTKYGNNVAREYVGFLEGRINEEKRLNQQMGK
jgi:tetratricopeptide (TPR) repeat protein